MKLFKKTIALLLIFVFVFSITACGDGDMTEEERAALNMDSETVQFFKHYKDTMYLRVITDVNDESIKLSLISNVEQARYQYNFDEEWLYFIKDGNDWFALDDNNEIAYRADHFLPEYGINLHRFHEYGDGIEGECKTGTMVIEGDEHEYEEFTTPYGTDRFCFNKAGMQWIIYTDLNGVVHEMELNKWDNRIDVRKFEIPKGYKIMEYEGSAS